mmetsp:Transcript_24494/g.83737  ORF Transcript_24494/g.83737 Transcript_24494/m.83737 type:complete len:220 (-) Transcript_24494:429-1088(-)
MTSCGASAAAATGFGARSGDRYSSGAKAPAASEEAEARRYGLVRSGSSSSSPIKMPKTSRETLCRATTSITACPKPSSSMLPSITPSCRSAASTRRAAAAAADLGSAPARDSSFCTAASICSEVILPSLMSISSIFRKYFLICSHSTCSCGAMPCSAGSASSAAAMVPALEARGSAAATSRTAANVADDCAVVICGSSTSIASSVAVVTNRSRAFRQRR